MNRTASKAFAVITVMLICVLSLNLFFYALTPDENVARIVAHSEKMSSAEEVRYYFDDKEGTITVYSVKTLEIDLTYIADRVKVLISQDGVMNYITEMSPSVLSTDEARAIVAKILWLYKTDTYNNTPLLDFTRTPITDDEGIERYPLLEEFSTPAKFTEYLKTVFTDNIAENYLNNTTITVFGNELYDIGGKVAQYSLDYENFMLKEIYTSENGLWRFYQVTIPNEDIDDMIDDMIFNIGLMYTENGWRIAYSELTNEQEYLYLHKYNSEQNGKNYNPATSDILVLFPVLLSVSLVSSIICLKKK